MTKKAGMKSVIRYLHFIAFFVLFAYTAKTKNNTEGPPTVMVQPPHKEHGMLPRTFLGLFGIAGLLPLVKKCSLHTIVPDGIEITERAKFFYSMTQCCGLAVLLILFVPIHFGNVQDQRNTTIAISIIEFVFGWIMFSGEAWNVWIRPSLHQRLLSGPIIVLGLAVLVLIGGTIAEKKKKKHEGYNTLSDSASYSDGYVVVQRKLSYVND
jgi:hypothetical protein